MYYTEKVYNPIKRIKEDEIDVFKLKEQYYNPEVEELFVNKLEYIEPIHIKYKPQYQYEEEEYKRQEYGDTAFYKWLSTQTMHESCIAILAEIVNAPKLSSKIEKIRPTVKDMPTMTIEDYRKLKCIGSTKVKWLKQMKKTYGINILRFLKASIS